MLKAHVLKSAIASFIAIIAFFVLAGIFEFSLRLLGELTAHKSSLQEVWSSLLSAILASCCAMKLVGRVIKDYRRIAVLLLFSVVLLTTLGWSLYYMIPAAHALRFGFKEFIITTLTPVLAIVTAFMTLKRSEFDEEKPLKEYGIADDDFE